jgi:hypothetical protein
MEDENNRVKDHGEAKAGPPSSGMKRPENPEHIWNHLTTGRVRLDTNYEESYKVQEWRTKKKLGAKKGLGKVKKPPCFRIQADSWGIKIQDIEELQGEQEHNHSKQMRWPRPR